MMMTHEDEMLMGFDDDTYEDGDYDDDDDESDDGL